MSNAEFAAGEQSNHWPSFSLRYTFNPDEVDGPEFGPDEIVVFDATRDEVGGAWLAASRGSYVAVEETR